MAWRGSPARPPRTSPTTASSTPRSAGPPSSTPRAGCRSSRSSTRCSPASARARQPRPIAGQDDPGRRASRPRCGTPPARARSPSSPCAYRDRGVVGFDIAGAEAGFPPTRHLDAFEYLRRENFHFTIHAGEAFGLPSIWEAIQWCGADRLGHGVRIVDDIDSRTARWAGWRSTSATSGSRSRCARRRTSRPARRPIDRRAPDRRAAAAALPGHGQHRQPADERARR